MKRCFIFLLILISLFVITACQQANSDSTNPAVNTYITNTINIIWKGSFATSPSNPEPGWAYYDTTKKMSFVWDGKSWQVIAQDGKSIVWKGELSSAPANPQENWAYFNLIDGNSYIYNGHSWDYLAKSGRDGASGIMLWLGSLASAPSNPSTGYCYYNTNDKCSYIWDGNSWEIIAQDGTDGISGKSIIWKGALSTAPQNPQEYWAYYNTTTKTSYIFNGNSWDILSQSIGGNTTVQVPVNWRGTFNAAPLNPNIGDAYYNSTTKCSYIYDGSVWQQISKDGQDGSYTYSGTGYLITWKGSLNSAPSAPQKGWAYYNSSEGKSYIWDGSSWQIMAQDGSGSSSSSSSSGYSYLYVLCYTSENNYVHSLNQPMTEVDFGTTGLNSSSKTTTFYISLQSSTKETLRLTGTPALQISGSDADCFSVIQPSITEVSSGSYIMDAAIIFTPTSLGEKTAVITIPNNSPDYPNFSFTVKGNGAYWPKTFDGGEGDGNDAILCAAEDSQGNLYFAGYGFELVNDHSGYDWWIKKFNKDGVEDTINWNKKIDYYSDYSTGYDYPKFIVIDNENNVCVASYYNATKFSPNGEILWTKNYDNIAFTGIYNNSKDTNILIKTNNNIQSISNNGSLNYSIDKAGEITFDNNGDLVLYNGTDYYVYNSTGTLLRSITMPMYDTERTISNISGSVISGYITKGSYQLWEIDVVKDANYTVYVYDDCDVKSSMYYTSQSAEIFTNVDSMSSTPKSFTAARNGKVILKVQGYNSSNSGKYTFKIISSVEIPCKIAPSQLQISSIGFDSNNNFYIGAYGSNLVGNFSRNDVILMKYSSEGIHDETNWDLLFDGGHCEDEKTNSISFNGTHLIFVGSGHDLINGASADDSWVKIYTTSGTLINSFYIDIASAKLISEYSNQLYFLSGDYYSSVLSCNKSGVNIKQYGLNSYGSSIVSNSIFLVSKYDGAIYIAGSGSNLVSSKSGTDWQILKF